MNKELMEEQLMEEAHRRFKKGDKVFPTMNNGENFDYIDRTKSYVIKSLYWAKGSQCPVAFTECGNFIALYCREFWAEPVTESYPSSPITNMNLSNIIKHLNIFGVGLLSVAAVLGAIMVLIYLFINFSWVFITIGIIILIYMLGRIIVKK